MSNWMKNPDATYVQVDNCIFREIKLVAACTGHIQAVIVKDFSPAVGKEQNGRSARVMLVMHFAGYLGRIMPRIDSTAL